VQKANGRKRFVSFCATSAFLLAVTAKGKLRFAAYDGHLNGPEDRKAKALAALHRLQRLPHLMRSPLPPDVIRSTLFLIGP